MKFSQLPQNLKVRLVSSFFNRVAMHAVLPFMALFFTHEKGKIYAGTILMISVGISICANILGGYSADRWKRKNILNGSTLLSHGALIIGTFLLPWHMSMLLATVVLLGICCIYFALYIKKEKECRI